MGGSLSHYEDQDRDKKAFDDAVAALRADVVALAQMLTNDAGVRALYEQEIMAAARAFEMQVRGGQISWATAAKQVNIARNGILELMRSRSSVLGRALAESMKKSGRPLDVLISKYSSKLYPGRLFSSLSRAEQNAVYAEIVRASGRSSSAATSLMARWGKVGRGLIVLSVAISVYNVAVAEDPKREAVKEIAVTGAGIGGAVLGGAAAGLVCGPGAPLCSGVLAFAAGALAAFGASSFF